VLFTKLLAQRGAQDSPADAGRGTEVRFARLPSRRVQCCNFVNDLILFRLIVRCVVPVLTLTMAACCVRRLSGGEKERRRAVCGPPTSI